MNVGIYYQWDDEGTLHGYKQVSRRRTRTLCTYWDTNILVYPRTSNEEITNGKDSLMYSSKTSLWNSTEEKRNILALYDTYHLTMVPFKTDDQAINDAKLYSQYGTTSKTLLATTRRRI